MQLKPHDVAVAILFCLRERSSLTYNSVAFSLGVSAAESHGAVHRDTKARLLVRLDSRPRTMPYPDRANIFEFLVHGVKYAFPPDRGAVVRGMPTAVAAPVLRDRFLQRELIVPVWPYPTGPVRGESFEPLYPGAPDAAQKSPNLYEAFALIDAIRGGAAREREQAIPLLRALVGVEKT